jgi:hypothetical protein
MAPKEKSKELFYNFYEIHSDDIDFGMNKEIAKKCALIAVDEVIQQCEVSDTYIADFGGKINKSLEYWEEVKQEIINL